MREVALDGCGAYEVVVEQSAFGVCHSQLDRIYGPDRVESMVLGHESIGTVVAVGERVDYVAPGDKVTTTWVARRPLDGRPPVPSQVVFPDGDIARTHNTFTWGTHAVLDEQYVVKAPDGISVKLGAIIGCAVMTGAGSVVNSAGVGAGQSVAVWGTGGVGLCAVAAAAIVGATPVIAVDVDDAKLQLARHFGATDLVNVNRADPVEAIRGIAHDRDGTAGVEFAFDCTGIGRNVPLSLASLRPGLRGSGRRGGSCVLVGIPRTPFELDSMALLEGEKSLLGCVGGSCQPERDFARFAAWSREGRFDADSLVTNSYSLDELNQAVDDLHHGRVRGRAVIEL